MYDITDEDLTGRSRRAKLVEARQMCWLVLRRKGQKTLESIGKAFGGRTHATVYEGIKHIENLIETDRTTRENYQKVTIAIAEEGMFVT